MKRGDIGSLVYLKGNSSTKVIDAMSFQVKDLVFVKGSRTLYQIPLIIVDIQSFQDGVDYILLDPQTGNRYAYQKHDLMDNP